MNKQKVLEKLKREEKRIRKVLLADSNDFEELQSEWQERDSPAERNLREVEWKQYQDLQNQLVEIEDAKARTANDIYGLCEDCEKDISEKRLLNIPTARRCIECQEKFEKNRGLANRRVTL